MVSTGGDKLCSDKLCADKDEFAECVDNINVLNLRLKNSDDRCQRLRTDLRLAKQVCDFIGSPSPPPPPPPLLLSSLLRSSPIHDHRWSLQDPDFAQSVSGRWTSHRFATLCTRCQSPVSVVVALTQPYHRDLNECIRARCGTMHLQWMCQYLKR